MPDFVKFYLPLLAWMLLIFTLSSLPGSTFRPIEFPDAHLIAHSLLFGILYYLGYRALKHQSFSRFLRELSLLLSVIFVALYGALDEYHQSFTPGRSEELKDFVWDVAAAVIVMIGVLVSEKVSQNKRKIEQV